MPEMTLLRNNPPQSLAQPMRQAYDYWQEVAWHKRKNRRKQAFLLQNYQQRKKGSARLLVLGVYPPPSRGSSPLLPVCKSYQQRKKRPSRGVYPPPPTRGRFPLLPVRKSYQRRKKRPSRGVYPPPRGAVPAITRMQKLSTVRETHCRALFRGFRVYIFIDKGQYCPRTTPSGWTAGHSLLVLLQSWHMPAAR